MATAIVVSPQFKIDFEFYCSRAGFSAREKSDWRDAIREDFQTVGAFVTEAAAVYRFCDETWPHGARPDLCEGYLASLGWFPKDDNLFMRLGIMQQVKLCMDVYNKKP